MWQPLASVKDCNPKATVGDKISALPKISVFYAWWYPTRWLKGLFTPSYLKFGKWAGHLRFIHRSAAKLARESFHGMIVYREKMERKQVFLFRLVDVVNELFAMTASIARAIAMEKRGAEGAAEAAMLTLPPPLGSHGTNVHLPPRAGAHPFLI